MKKASYEIDMLQQSVEVSDENIDKTKKIVAALQEIMSLHNSRSQNKASLKELKKVFKRGAENEDRSKNPNPNYHGLARVNMYLQLLDGYITITNDKQRIQQLAKTHLIDLTDSYSPSEEEYRQADAAVIKFGLHISF